MRRSLVFVAFLLAAAPAYADDVRPISLDVKEQAGSRFAVRFQTPMRGGMRLKVRLRLPKGAERVRGSYDAQVSGGTMVERFAFVLQGGLVGKELGVEGLALGARNALVHVQLRDGRTLRAVLGGSRQTFRIEAAEEQVRPPWTERVAAEARAGFAHGPEHPAHLLLVAALVLAAAEVGVWALALGAFLVLGLAGSGSGLLAGVAIAPSLAEALVALAAVIIAREAALGSRRRLVTLVGLAGLIHGLAGSVSPAGLFGLDLAHLAAGALLGAGFRFMPAGARRATAWAVGGLAVAVAVAAATEPEKAVASTDPGTFPTSADSAPPAGPVRALETDVEAYLDVGVFESRLEVLARFEPLRQWLGVPKTEGEIETYEQADLLKALSEALLQRLRVTIDEAAVLPSEARHGFAVFSPTGTYVRQIPMMEVRDEALVGLVFVYRATTIPRTVAVRWAELPPTAPQIGARVIDPELTRDSVITAAEPELAWTNTLAENPLPSVEAVQVRKRDVPLPIASLAVLLMAISAATIVRDEKRRTLGLGALRVGVALAMLIAPSVSFDVSGLVAPDVTPTPQEARAITRTLIENVYQAHNARAEDDVFDRLAASMSGDTLVSAYLASRKALAFEVANGARTHVDAVELRKVEDVQPSGNGGFTATAKWTVAGSVTHLGHRHLRQNLHTAKLGIAPVDGAWKISLFEVLDLERQR